MNAKLLFLAISAAAISSCSSVYKSGQTPDDVYYSPQRTYQEDIRREEDYRDQARQQYNNEDRQIRLGINNARWRGFDNEIGYNPYQYGYNYGYYYNPYYCTQPVYNPVVIVTSNPKNSTPRTVNLGGYGNGYNNNNIKVDPKTGVASIIPVRTYNSNNGSRLGNALRQILSTGGGNYNNNNNSRNNSTNTNRTYTPSSSNSSSKPASSSSSSGSTTSRPARNGKG